MKLNSKLISVFIALAAISQTATAEPLNILVPFPPGGLTDQTLRAIDETAKTKGVATNYLILNNCKNTENWLKKNPSKPAITVFSVQEQINAALNPTADNACGIVATKENTLALTLTAPMNICSMMPPSDALAHFRRGKHKIGTTFSPPTNGILVKGIIDSLGLNSALIEYQGNPALVQALISKDIDFALFSNVQSAISAGATCFLTTAPKEFAKSQGRTSLEEISFNNPWIGNSQMNVAIAWNVDRTATRAIVIEAMKTNPNMKKQLSVGYTMPGMISGTTENEQWKIIADYVNSNIKK